MRKLLTPVFVFALAASAAGLQGCGGNNRTLNRKQAESEVDKLKRKITKVRYAIESTKDLIRRARGQSYLADLYMRLSELYIEEARYHYFIAYEGQKRRSKAVDSVQTRLLKDRAIGIYQRILDEYPAYEKRDQVLFFMAHEHRELGNYDRMAGYLKRVVDEHPKSAYRNEALLVLGDHHFDRNNLPLSEKYYSRVLKSKESVAHGMARYKLAWIRINQNKFPASLKLFEASVRGLAKLSAGDAVETRGKKIDLRREALVDLVYPYTEVHKKSSTTKSLNYFRALADSRSSYLLALSKLAKRWFVKGRYKTASGIYRELLALGGDHEDAIEWARRLYDGVTKGKLYQRAARDTEIVATVSFRRKYDWRLSTAQRKQIQTEFEAYARDIATKTQLKAKRSKDKKLFRIAGDAYEIYLRHFGDAKSANDIRINLAEARFDAGQWYEAGEAYRDIVPLLKKGQSKTLRAAVEAYDRALKKPWELGRLSVVRARDGLRRSAREYIALEPKSNDAVKIKFTLAKSYYDDGSFDRSAQLFAALVNQYPTTQEAKISAELALDALRAEDAYEEMAMLGRVFAGNSQLPASTKSRLRSIVSGAETRALQTATLDAGYKGGDASASLLAFAERNSGTALGEKALTNAFVTAQSQGDLGQAEQIAQKILTSYPKSKLRGRLFATLGEMHAQSASFAAAGKYWEQASTLQTGEARRALLKSAAVLKGNTGDLAGAQELLKKAIQSSQGNERAEHALALANLMADHEQHAQAAWAFKQSGRASADDTIAMQLAVALRDAGDNAGARQQLDRILRGGGDEAAGALYYAMLPSLKRFTKMKPSLDGIGDKVQKMNELEAQLLDMLRSSNALWITTGLAALNTVYGNTARYLRAIPPPPGLDAGALQEFKQVLEGQAAEVAGKAEEARSTCQVKARELKLFSPSARACLTDQEFLGDPMTRVANHGTSTEADTGAAARFRKKIAANSKDYVALVGLAMEYLKMNNPHAARLVLDKAAEGGASSEVFNLRGVVLWRLGFPQSAHADFSEAADLDPSNVYAAKNLGALYQSYGYKRLAEAQNAKLTGKTFPPGDLRIAKGAQ